MNMQQIKDLADRMAFQAPPMAPDTSLRDFKIDFGLDLVSRSPRETYFKQQAQQLKNLLLILETAEQHTTKVYKIELLTNTIVKQECLIHY